METAAHTALDGSRVTITAEADLSLSASSVGVLSVDREQREMTASSLELGSWAAGVVSGITLSEAYSLQGGTLRVGHRQADDIDAGLIADIWAGVWEGKESSLLVHMYGAKDNQPVLALFDRLRIEELYGEATAVPATQGDIWYQDLPSITKQIPDVGLINVERLTPEMVNALPQSPGTAVLGGELYFDDEGVPHFLLLSSKTATTVTPGEDLDKTAAVLSKLTIDWADPI